MPRREAWLPVAAVIAAALWVGGAMADDPAQAGPWRLDRLAELPGHAALARLRAAPGVDLAPFETDGCSGGMSGVWTWLSDAVPAFAARFGARPPWEACCIVHDVAYHAAGPDPDPEAGFAARLAADAALRDCVRDVLSTDPADLGAELSAALAPGVAEAMHLAVRLGGGPCSGLPWRWGYGWPHCVPFE